ncbi:CotH kinase family protein [Psychrosphaera sp. 1_MG-2023]|uniref:CotH kinase family protein n=1 Tax=Psychrosphaera sp. 1_MG-2023 TaxID=3062643 RepID=UPI0026E2953A|nr:CotH kinase family protein [Psychrosphaera sp. 1_MG-2023]MDO6718869.1 CotH kinase family protein [Psychrosphaera sp. 1_MG-2023]
MTGKPLRHILACLLLLFSNVTIAVEDTSFLAQADHKYVFDINALPSITLTFSDDEWQSLLQSSREVPYEVPADFSFDKNGTVTQLTSVGVKLSGNTSFVLPDDGNGQYRQAHFSLDFDEFVDKQTFSKLSKLRLKRFHNDPTFVHEPLSNQIMHNFDLWTAHSSTYARLFIKVGAANTAYFGVYRMNESVNRKEYIDKRFGTDNDKGFLWQGNHKGFGAALFSNIQENWQGIDVNDQATFEFKGKDDDFEQAKSQLITIANNFTQLSGNEFKLYIEQHLDIPVFLKFLAAEAVLGHWDGFWGNGNNYYFYIDESEVVYFIPYDTDNALGTSLLVEDVGSRNPMNFAARSPILVEKVLAIAQYRTEFKALLAQLVNQDNLMTEHYSTRWISDVHQLIQYSLLNDTGDNQQITDEPAYWGNQSSYRLFDFSSGKNWYTTRKSAVLSGIKSDDHIYPSLYFRGVTNQWGTTPMIEIEDNIWQVTVNNNEATNATGVPRFKFDVYADWSTSFGDSNTDGIAELGGDSIPFDDGFGEYLIQFNAFTGAYTMFRTDKPNVAPTANAGPDLMVTVGESVQLDGSASSDQDGQIIQFVWSIGAEGETTIVEFVQTGVFEVTLTVTDEHGATATDKVTITVNAIPDEPKKSGSANLSFSVLLLLVLFVAVRRRCGVERHEYQLTNF